MEINDYKNARKVLKKGLWASAVYNMIIAQNVDNVLTGVITTIPKHKRIKLSPKKYNKLKEEVFERDQQCVLCDKQPTDLHHVIFRSQMGDDSRVIRVVLLQYLEAVNDEN